MISSPLLSSPLLSSPLLSSPPLMYNSLFKRSLRGGFEFECQLFYQLRAVHYRPNVLERGRSSW